MLFFPGGWSPRPGQTLVRAGFRSLSPWQHTSPASLRGEPHGQRSLEDHSPQGHTESDVTEHLSTLAADHPCTVHRLLGAGALCDGSRWNFCADRQDQRP